ncbi:PREDICTED: uncharacterized protein LOC105568358 [Vollenhovia emeryi]|uniref:uncharacterized protein LOC105568358 n=1 Tax=Vollenhovia emeryi TaxID=411798 RepID=UPI0005F406F9|nr:PREDICTED: uncharacterized protein LOC105568358 [Vollenhovia emeryi]
MWKGTEALRERVGVHGALWGAGVCCGVGAQSQGPGHSQEGTKEGGSKGGLGCANQTPRGAGPWDAILPKLEEWLDRPWTRASYRTTQVLSGHGCFGEYLCRIGRDRTPRCNHCGGARDTAQHTLQECPAWEEERSALTGVIGDDLSLGKVIEAIVESEEGWEAFHTFCERVMSSKESAERERRGETNPRDGADGGGGAPPGRRPVGVGTSGKCDSPRPQQQRGRGGRPGGTPAAARTKSGPRQEDGPYQGQAHTQSA